MHKRSLWLVLALFLLASAGSAWAQTTPQQLLTPEMEAALAKEKPLSQADVDLYLQVLPKIPTDVKDTQAMMDFYTSTGLSETRFSYVFAKIPLALGLASGAPDKMMGLGQLPKVLHPTEAEVNLVRQNRDALQKVLMDAAASFEKAQKP